MAWNRDQLPHAQPAAGKGPQGRPPQKAKLTVQVAEVFGYAGDRKFALPTLMAAGGWSKDSDQPEYTEQNEGIRRPVCDMILLTFHLVISVLM